VQEDDTHFYPNSTYGLSKVLSHQLVQYFRNNYNLHASNGIIFTTECKYRNKLFLLQKCAQHAKRWHETQEPLHLGNLQSHRVLTHADDVANGIQFILQQPCAADYIVCGDDKYCVEDVVVQLYAKANIYLQKTKDGFVDKLTNQIVLQVGECMRHTNTDIYANVQKLKALGWSAKKTLDDILSEYIRDT
jgi:GDP-D-mannose dehydratase